MKALFCKIFNFFQEKNCPIHGQNYQTAPYGDQIGGVIAQFQQRTTEQPEVERAPRQQPRRTIQADPSAPGIQGPEKQRPGHTQPEHKVQQAAQQPHRHPHPEDAKQVVYHPRRPSQQQGLQHSPALVPDGYAHAQPNSRDSRPPRPPLSSS